MHPSQFAVRSDDIYARERVAASTPLGRVTSVSGSRAVVAVDVKSLSLEDSDPLSVGKLLLIEAGDSMTVALIYAAESAASNKLDTMLASVELLGEIRASKITGKQHFDRGIKTYPPVGAPAREMDASALETIYDYSGEETISIGKLSQDDRIEATVRVQDLLQKHFAVLGTTGCGKSSTVVLILDRILKATDSTRILMIDPHNEYASAFQKEAEVVSPRTLSLPFWLFNFEEIVDVIYRRRPGVTEEIDALSDLIPLAKARYAQGGAVERSSSLVRKEVEDSGFTVDSPVPYRIGDIIAMIDEQIGKLDAREGRPTLRRLKARIQSVISDTRYQFMFSSRTIEDTMADLLRTLFRIPAEGKRITIVEMAGFPAEVVDAVVSVLCRLAFDLGVWGRARVPLLVVAEEAHRYVPVDKRLGFGPTRRSISRIAKEGRKYGVYLGLVTQRPAELDPTILSQCSSIFAMRMANESDHAIIRSAVSDAASSTLAALPSIGNREAIAFGEAVSMPMRVRFASLPAERLPKNQLPTLQTSLTESETRDFVDEVVERWRSVARRER